MLAIAYGLALAASYAVRWRSPITPEVRERERIAVQVVDGLDRLPELSELAYRVWGPSAVAVADAPKGAVPILLLHGSPGSADDFTSLGPALAGTGRTVLAPDFPGFGGSTRSVPDYSVLAHAGYVLQLLEKLDLERVHVVGFSMGGGVGLRLWQIAPKSVESMVMLSAIGVQELELLGSHPINHLLHGIQLTALRGLRDLTPHFGFFDRFPLDVPYARNFYDTDQRPLRAVLETFEPPMLILHGERDPLVPRQAAEEHYRIVPQSELEMLAASHFFVFRGGQRIAPQLLDFFDRVEAGRALRRQTADPLRVAAAEEPYAPSRLPPWTGPALPAVFLMLALGTLISEDLTCIAAGLLVAQGRVELWPAILACYVGIVGGDLLLFWAGRVLGRRIVHRAPLRWWITEEAIDESSRWLRKRGPWVILVTRVLPGARLPTNLAAGVLRTRFWRFLLYFVVAGMFWTPLIVTLSATLGESLLGQLDLLRGRFLVLVIALGVLMYAVRHLVVPLATWRGRRNLHGAWRRLTRWEYWPSWAIYPPVIVYLLYLGLKYRSLTLFTCVNPAIPLGGFHGESKAEIYRQLPEGLVPDWELLPAATPTERSQRVIAFMAERDSSFPIVLKPDAGERGRGVAIVRSESEIVEYLETHPGPTLAQRFVPGLEYGVFWMRGPDEAEGEIFGINAKIAPSVTGDGEHTLEHLILDDERAFALAPTYLREQPDAKTRVPEAGEEVPLTEVGAHSRGTMFLEATDLGTPELQAAIGRVADAFEGFDYGRLDLRVENQEAFQQGGPFQILEINGVTSEATNLYDPNHSLLNALGILCRQWRRAFEIGDQRRRLGARPAGIRALLVAWWSERRRRRTLSATAA